MKRAREERAHGGGGPRPRPSTIGVAFRIAVELVAGLAVGVAIGWALDRWLGTGPWLLILFFFLGAAAGILNVYRSAKTLGLSGGSDAPPEDESRDRER